MAVKVEEGFWASTAAAWAAVGFRNGAPAVLPALVMLLAAQADAAGAVLISAEDDVVDATGDAALLSTYW